MRPSLRASDEELMTAYQEGEHEAFAILYERYKGKIYSFISKRIANKTDVNDVFQQVFMKLHTSRNHYSSAYTFAPWIFTISRTSLIDFYRKQKNSKATSFTDDLVELKNSILEFEESQHISVLLREELSPVQTSAITMKVFDEAAYEDMAKALNISESNLRQTISRSIKKLKTALATSKGGV